MSGYEPSDRPVEIGYQVTPEPVAASSRLGREGRVPSAAGAEKLAAAALLGV
ncbi:MAG: hypothetical protein H0V26_11770 [Solirubrobacterales bacterium]|jgi:hypothetical protein|nr:hypothetical protein [Solirubrobacterales bacterium]